MYRHCQSVHLFHKHIHVYKFQGCGNSELAPEHFGLFSSLICPASHILTSVSIYRTFATFIGQCPA